MKRSISRTLGGLLGSLALAISTHGASEKTAPRPAPPPSPLSNATLAPALKAAADRDQIKLFTIDNLGEAPAENDFTVAWVGTADGKNKQQWLIQFRRSTATAAEQKSAQNHDKKKYLSWGPVVTFKSEVQALELWIAGPVTITDPMKPDEIAPVKRVRLMVPADYLRLGLDNSLRVDQHMRRRFDALRKEDPKFKQGGIYALDSPISPEKIAGAKKIADKIEFTPEMERAWIGGYIALEAFYNLANDVPAIETIAAIAVDKPPVWKLAKLATGTRFMTSFGGPDTKVVDLVKAGLIPVPTESFQAPFSFGFGHELIVSGLMAVTAPTPPFDTTAGILALLAFHPTDPNRQVQIAIISGVRGKPAAP